MADFGIINLQPEGDVTSYDPPDALVYEFGTFHDEIKDKIVSVMSLLPNATARPSIDKLRRTKEKPGAKRSVLKANKAFSKIEIPKDTPVLTELDDNDAMRIPFFQYANVDKYYTLENQGKTRKEILQQSVDLSKIKNRSDATPLTSYYHQDFDLKSMHPGVTFIDKQRASFAGFYTGPILDGYHKVALHGFLQEPVNIAVRSGFNTRVVKLPIGFEMVVPLRSGVIHYDEDGKPVIWTSIPAGLKRLPPPPPGDGGLPEFPEVPTYQLGGPSTTPTIKQTPRVSVPKERGLNGTIPGYFDPADLNRAVEPPSLGDIEMTTIPPSDIQPTSPSENQPTTPSESQSAIIPSDVQPAVISPKKLEEAEPVPVEEGTKKVKPYVKTATVTPTFKEDVIADLTEYIKLSGIQLEDVNEELKRYEPLTSYLNKVTSTFPNKAYTIEMPSQTTNNEYDTFVDEAKGGEDIIRIAFKDPSVKYEFRIEIAGTPSNIVERIDGRANIVAVSRPVSFRMKPNPSRMKYTLFLRHGTPVVVARPAKFRMDPNESLREFVKIEP